MAVTAVMHLLFLVAFSWMLVEGLLLWSKVVAVNMGAGLRMRLYYATGWGEAPLLPALSWFSSTLPYTASIAVHHCPALNTAWHPSLGPQHCLAPTTNLHPAPLPPSTQHHPTQISTQHHHCPAPNTTWHPSLPGTQHCLVPNTMALISTQHPSLTQTQFSELCQPPTPIFLNLPAFQLSLIASSAIIPPLNP